MVVIDGIEVPVESIVRIEGNHAYTSDYMKIYVSKDDIKKINEKKLVKSLNF